MLRNVEIEPIKNVLKDILGNYGGRAVFRAHFPDPSFLVELATLVGGFETPHTDADAAIKLCIRREWSDDPAWLILLLEAIQTYSGAGGIGEVPGISEIIQRIHRKVNILNEMWYTQWLQFGMPFLSRATLRDTLCEFSQSTGRGILRIDGETQSGKSYSSELLEFVSSARSRSFKVVRVEIKPGAELDMDALQLARLIVGELGFSIAPSDVPLNDLRVQNVPILQTWILQKAQTSGQQVWLVLDGFKNLTESNNARDLLEGLADKIANGAARQYMRLVLVDYDRALARVEDEKVALDIPTQPTPALSKTEVRLCLEQLYTELKKTPSPGKVDAISDAIVNGIPPSAPWMAEVNKRVRAAARGIRNEP